MYLIFLYVVHAEIGLNKLTRIEWHEIAKKHKNVAKHGWFKWKGYQLWTNKKYKIGHQSNKKRFSKVQVIGSSRRLAKDTTWKSSTFFHERTIHGALYVWNRFCGRIDGGGASTGGGDPIEEKPSLSAIRHIGARLIFRRFYLIFPC